MKRMLMIVLGVMLVAGGVANSQEVTLDQVVGTMVGPDSLQTGQEVTFYLRLTNPTANAIAGLSNGFRVYSGDGAVWTDISAAILPTLTESMFDLVLQANADAYTTGGGADTVTFAGSVFMTGTGMPAGFDDTAFTITIGPLSTDNHGKTICVDSSWFPPSNVWKWAVASGPTYFPDWDGPHCYTIVDPLDVAERPDGALPEQWSLGQNYPNPFNAGTQIQFDVRQRANVSLVVYNVLGQQVATLVDEPMDAGSYTVDWDGYSDGGSSVSSGIYFYRLQSDDFVDTKKMVLMK